MEKQTKIIGNPNAKSPAYVKAYEQLYSDITSGVYKDGDQLPSENCLSKQHKISRNTLRQALAILHEDGLIRNVQGKGNFVCQAFEDIRPGFERITNPMLEFAKTPCDMIKIDFHFSPVAEIVQKKINISASEIALTSNNVYLSNGKPIGHAFMQIPVKYIADMNVDLNNEVDVHNIINKVIYDMAVTASARFKLTFTEESTSNYLQVDLNTPVMFVEEILYNADGEGYALCKFYFVSDEYRFHLIRKK